MVSDVQITYTVVTVNALKTIMSINTMTSSGALKQGLGSAGYVVTTGYQPEVVSVDILSSSETKSPIIEKNECCNVIDQDML